MRSLVPVLERPWLLCHLALSLFGWAPLLALAGLPVSEGAVISGSFLEIPRIMAVGSDGEIHIPFSAEVRYVRHSPEEFGDTLRIFLEVVDPCVAEGIVAQESRWLPPADWFVPFTVSFPEILKRTGSSTAVCPSTGHRVDIGGTVLVKFRQLTRFKVRRGDDRRSIVITVPLLKPAPEQIAAGQSVAREVVHPAEKNEAKGKLPRGQAPPPSRVQSAQASTATANAALPQGPAQTASEPKSSPAELMRLGRTALDAGDAVQAIQMFNQLLNQPPNEHTQEAQELIGVAREKAGEAAKARAEYQLYLKLYPEGDGATRVSQRLAALDAAKPQPDKTKETPKPKKAFKQISQNTVTGSISQYYYGGKSSTFSKTADDPTTRTVGTDQSSLITNIDVNGRFRHNQYDTKIVFRDTEAENALPNRAAKNTVSQAYVEHENKEYNYMFRIGRQSGTSQGVLGRFDGAFGRYGLNDQWRLTAVIGQPDYGSHNKIDTNRHFYGVGVEFGPLAEKWTGTLYGIEQVADGFSERRAFGTEVRYFNGTTSWFGMAEYDMHYDAVNLAMLQGNWVAFDGYNFNFLIDHRKSPILTADTALQAGSLVSTLDGSTNIATRVRDLLHNPKFSDEDIYSIAKRLTAESNMVMLGVTKQVTSHWQLGGDVRVNWTTSTSGVSLPADASFEAVDIPPQARSGYIYSYTAQAIGSDVLLKGDTTSLLYNYINDPKYNAQNYSLSHSMTLREHWRVDSALGYYHEHRANDIRTWKITPSIRFNYRFKDTLSFEAQYTLDRTRTDDPTTDTWSGSTRQTLFMGYRWDYR